MCGQRYNHAIDRINSGGEYMTTDTKTTYSCENCPMRKKAEEKPNSLIARFWRWHTGWCPGWKAYQKALAEQQE
jgi:hypothetical protein